MTKEKMNVHKALAELKLLDNRIIKEVNDATFAIANKHSNEKISGISVAEFTAHMKDGYQSVCDLILRRDAMKRAVVKSNAVTEVVIAGKTYTVAEAIEMKNHGVYYKEMLLTKMREDVAKTKMICDRNNGDALEAKANEYIQNIFGSSDMKNGLSEEAAKKRREYIEMQSYEMLDPIGVVDAINSLSAEIQSFRAEVDAALSVSNALTEVEFEY